MKSVRAGALLAVAAVLGCAGRAAPPLTPLGAPGSGPDAGPQAALSLPSEAAWPSLCRQDQGPCRAQLAALLEREPARAEAWRALGWSDYLDGATERAGDELARAQRLLPGDARTLFGLALLAQQQGRDPAAIDGLVALLERADPADPWATPLAAEAAAQLGRLALEVPGLAALAARLARLDGRRLGDPAWERLMAVRARLARRLGDEAEGERLDRERGCPAQLLTYGPYGHLPALDLATPFPPDRADPAGARRVPGRGCLFTVATPQGQRGVAYAVLWLRVERAAVARVRLASERPYHLIVDGQTVLEQVVTERWPALSTSIEVTLQPGVHRVALKLAAPDARAVAALRIAPAPGLTLLDSPPPRAPRPGGVLAVRPAVTWLLPLAAANEQPRLARYLAGRHALAGGDAEGAEAAAAVLLREAPRFVPGLLLAAEAASADASRPRRVTRDRARRHYERALALDPACVPARYQLVDYDLDEDRAERALARLSAAPAPDCFRLAWARYRVLHARDWDVEAEQALAEARARGPEACQPLEGEVEVALDRRDSRRALAAARALVACAPESEQLADLLRGELGDPLAAAAEYRRLLALEPARESALRGLADSLAEAGQAGPAAEVLRQLIALQPRNPTFRRQLADALLSAGQAPAARQAVLDGLAESPEAQELHRALAALSPGPGHGVMDPFRLDGQKVIADYQRAAPGWKAPAVIVLDRTVARVFSTGARLTLTHNIMRVQTKEGIDRFGEVTIPEGADVLLLRTVKSDGSTREAPEIAGKRSVSVPDLLPGDYVEFEYIEPAGPPVAFPGGFYSERFFFSSFDAPLDRTEYVVVTPAGMPLQVDLRGAAPAAALTTIDDPLGAGGALEVRTWADRGKAQLVPEPQQAPFVEYVPSVRVASRVGFAGWRDFLDDNQFASRRANRELRELAARLRTPEAIDEWVRRHIQQGGPLDESATSILARGEGNRVVLERALLQAVGIRSTLWLARARTDAQLDGPLPDLEGFDEPLLAVELPGVAAGDPPLWVVPGFRHAPLGFVPPPLRGARALSLGEPGAAEVRFATVPAAPPAEASAAPVRQITLEATLAADGSAEVSVREVVSGWPALEWREGLDRIDEGRVRAEFEQHTLGFYFPSASLKELTVGPREKDAAPLVVEYRFHAPRFARSDGQRLVLGVPYPALLARRYVGVAERGTPLQLAYSPSASLEAIVHLPAGASATPAPPVALSGFGDFRQEVELAPGEVRLHQRLSLPAERVPPGRYREFVRWAEIVDRAEARAALIELPPPPAAAPPRAQRP